MNFIDAFSYRDIQFSDIYPLLTVRNIIIFTPDAPCHLYLASTIYLII